MNPIRKAFTLIELLVVIAIIAILAAILFPVFAQAKVAAKGAASISNNKQINTAELIYSPDYDDRAVLIGNMGDADAPFLLLGTPYKPWSYLLLPYMKSTDLFQDPLYIPEPNETVLPTSIVRAYRTQFAYAYSAHSPVTLTTGWNYNTISNTELAEPADTVKFIGKKARNGQGDWLWQAGGISSALWLGNVVPPPYCLTDTDTGTNPRGFCPPVRWGAGGFWAGLPPPTYEEGNTTGGVALRKSQQAVVSFGDGHCRTMQPSRLASGTNWSRTQPYNSIVITDIKKYMWDKE